MKEKMKLKKEFIDAESRIREHIRETPLEHSLYLSKMANCNVYLKCENLQITGSFKLRGAMNKLLSLPQDEKEQGIITASSGNHGAAVAYSLNKFAFSGTIYLPEDASPAKIDSLRLYGADIKFYGDDCVKTEAFAKKIAARDNQTFISPYNDPKIIAGQGTIGMELTRQIDNIDSIFIPVGGGGLISGVAAYLKSINDNIQVIGCQPKNSAVMYESVKAGKIVDLESKPTISDGSAGGIEPGSITFDICKKYVDDFVLVTEEEIKDAIKLIIQNHYMLTEGAGALSVASFIRQKEKYAGQNVVLILSGGKISSEKLKEIIC